MRWLLLGALVVLYPVVAFHPYEFRWIYPRNHAERLGDGSLRFSDRGIVRTEAPPAWLETAKRQHRIEVSLRIRPFAERQRGPARVFTLSADPYQRDLTLGQEGDRWILRVRTDATDDNGFPEVALPGTVRVGQWTDVTIAVEPGRLRAAIGGRTVLEEPLSATPLAGWSTDFRLALGNELTGDRPWRGEISRAVVRVGAVPGTATDYLDPARTRMPGRLLLFNHRPKWVPFVHLGLGDALLNVLGFVPLGVVVGWLGRSRSRPTLLAGAGIFCAVSLAIEIVQLCLPARFPSIDDVILNTAGGLLGLWGWRRARCARGDGCESMRGVG
jgi:hypothetical protein